MKNRRKRKKILLYLVAVLIAAVVFLPYFANRREKMMKLDDEIENLQKEVADLEDYELHLEENRADTEKRYKEISSIMAQFPADMNKETALLYTKELESGLGLRIDRLDTEPGVCLYHIGAGQRQRSLYSYRTVFHFTGTYQMVKQMINNIQVYPQKRRLVALDIKKDGQTGLSGTAVLNLYSLEVPGQKNGQLDTGVNAHGTSNVFGQ